MFLIIFFEITGPSQRTDINTQALTAERLKTFVVGLQGPSMTSDALPHALSLGNSQDSVLDL